LARVGKERQHSDLLEKDLLEKDFEKKNIFWSALRRSKKNGAHAHTFSVANLDYVIVLTTWLLELQYGLLYRTFFTA